MKNSFWKPAAAVSIGGAAGSAFRAVLADILSESLPFPLDICIINIFGSFCMGLLTAAIDNKLHISPATTAFLGTGLLGGFTTFSTFALDAALLWKDSPILSAAVFLGLPLLCCIGAGTGFYLTGRKKDTVPHKSRS